MNALGVLLALAAAAVLLAALATRRAARQHGTPALIWRWFSGAHWHGEALTDAGWFRRGVRVLHRSGHASRWAHKPRAARAAIRTGATGAALGSAAAARAHALVTLEALAALGALGLAWGAWRLWRRALDWRHYRAWVRPLHVTLGRALGLPSATRPHQWLTVPRGFQTTDGAQIRIALPAHFTPAEDAKRALVSIASAKLALESPRASWHLAGDSPSVTLTAQLAPPDRVGLAAVRELVAQAADTAPLLGLGRGRRPVYADLDNDSPHVLISAGSGGGKSTITRTIAAQVLARGGLVLILDIKRLSHAWARGLPGVRYARDIAEIHDALLWLGAEVDRRNLLADAGADADGNTDHVDVGPRLLVVCEEMNATSNRLAAYWRKIKDRDDAPASPAIEALNDALFMGRGVRTNVVAIAQMLTARTVGGPEARENMGVRILSRYTVNAWRMLVPEIWPAPRASRHQGRAQVCVAGSASETQIMYLSPAEARQLAAQGGGAAFPRGDQAAEAAAPVRTLHPVGGELVGLAAAVRRGLVPLSLDAIRKARQRDPEFPAPRGQGSGGELLYDPDEIAAWCRNRPRAATA